jgi:response regulator of citrate/malate metabolism
MSTTNTQSLKTTISIKGKDKQFMNELNIIFHYLKNTIATATMVTEATGVPQKSICRYKRTLEKKGLLFEVEKRHCKITGFRAWYLTTDKSFIPITNQLKMF